jgi:predicted RNA binding protein YcfA (HicA-like mRNA interferase family)
MPRSPVDAPKKRVIKTLQSPGFEVVHEGNHIAMARQNPDGSRTPLTIPNLKKLKSSTLRTMCNQAGIPRNDFLNAYEKAG